MSDRIEDKDIKEIKAEHKKIDVTSKSIFSVAQNITTIGADYVKALIDVELRVVTFLFIKRHIIPRQVENRELALEGIHDEAFLEIKVPFETAFALSTYMNESLKNIHTDKTIGMAFGPNQATL